jgi:hypothetical protein
MLSGVMLLPLYPPVHCEWVSVLALRLGISQAWFLVSLAGAVSGISKQQYFYRTELLYCCYILFSQTVFAHTTSAISYCPISDRHIPAHCTAVTFCSVSFCTHHICHILLSYIWPPNSSPLYCCYILFSPSVFAHTTSAISHYPISDRYLPSHCATVTFCSVNQLLHTTHLPYHTTL